MRVDVLIKLIFFDIEINTHNIIARLKNNNLFLIFAYKKSEINDNLIQFRIIDNNVNVEAI